jgi:chemotaxis protein CheC
MLPQMLDDDALDAICELMNIGVGRAAGALSELLGRRIDLSVPTLAILDACVGNPPAVEHAGRPQTTIVQRFEGAIQGCANLIFPGDTGWTLARLLADTDARPEGDGIDVELEGILLEVGNIVLNGVLGSISNAMDVQLTYTVPVLCQSQPTQSSACAQGAFHDHWLVGNIRFSVASESIEGTLILMFTVGSLASVLHSLACASPAAN